jgi:hypothetical protein
MINQLGDAPPPATTKPVTSAPDTPLTNAWQDAVAHAQANSSQRVTAQSGVASSDGVSAVWDSFPRPSGPVTITEAIRDQQLQEEQDCTAPGSFGPLGYNPPLSIDTNAPRAEALPPGALQAAANRAAAEHALFNWLSDGDLPPDPHVPDPPDPSTEVKTQTFGGPVPVQYPDASGGDE